MEISIIKGMVHDTEENVLWLHKEGQNIMLRKNEIKRLKKVINTLGENDDERNN